MRIGFQVGDTGKYNTIVRISNDKKVPFQKDFSPSGEQLKHH